VLDDEERPVMSEQDAGSCAADAGTRVALGRMLAGLRQDAGLSQRQLARLVGFSHTAVAHSEKGRRAVAEAFWTLTDTTLGAGGALAALYDRVRARELAAHENERRQRQAAREERAALRLSAGQTESAGRQVASGLVTEAICPHCRREFELVPRLSAGTDPGIGAPS
jgi:transcriptional regulator with XRE-family HTH domain